MCLKQKNAKCKTINILVYKSKYLIKKYHKFVLGNSTEEKHLRVKRRTTLKTGRRAPPPETFNGDFRNINDKAQDGEEAQRRSVRVILL